MRSAPGCKCRSLAAPHDTPMSLPWDFSTLADRLHDAIAAAEAELRLEQAVYGLDRLPIRF